MNYEKQTWQTGETITAEKLNHMEDGIALNSPSNGMVIHMTYDENELEHPYSLDKTYQEITNAIESGINPIVISEDEGITSLFTIINYRFALDWFSILLSSNEVPTEHYAFAAESATATLTGHAVDNQ